MPPLDVFDRSLQVVQVDHVGVVVLAVVKLQGLELRACPFAGCSGWMVAKTARRCGACRGETPALRAGDLTFGSLSQA
jgi:hypothetical protein